MAHDLRINRLGFVEAAVIDAVTPEHFDKTFNTNARGTYFTIQKALPLMNDGGSIVLIASAGKNKWPSFLTPWSDGKWNGYDPS